jgi:hypothetical protein
VSNYMGVLRMYFRGCWGVSCVGINPMDGVWVPEFEMPHSNAQSCVGLLVNALCCIGYAIFVLRLLTPKNKEKYQEDAPPYSLLSLQTEHLKPSFHGSWLSGFDLDFDIAGNSTPTRKAASVCLLRQKSRKRPRDKNPETSPDTKIQRQAQRQKSRGKPRDKNPDRSPKPKIQRQSQRHISTDSPEKNIQKERPRDEIQRQAQTQKSKDSPRDKNAEKGPEAKIQRQAQRQKSTEKPKGKNPEKSPKTKFQRKAQRQKSRGRPRDKNQERDPETTI